jgi:hypothetical protein
MENANGTVTETNFCVAGGIVASDIQVFHFFCVEKDNWT